MQASDKHPMEYSILAGFLTPCAVFGVSVGCLEGVWEVSGGCLCESGYCLGGMMCKQLINTQLCLGPIDAKSIAISPVEMIN